jgi:imidazole glycerol-phosphate synthase subunit HisH
MIVILDYGMGNPGSILNMLRKSGGDARITADHVEVAKASAIILPGVGSFDNGMQKLEALGLVRLLNTKVVDEKTPFLGICLGMQLLFDQSEEGLLPGLGWIKGGVIRFDFSQSEDRSRLKVPHMGWNLVNPLQYDTLFKGLESEARFYFVHSYHGICSDKSNVIALSNYGYDFACAVKKDNIFGVQFHPEKSHRFGLALFKNFLEHLAC